MKACSDGKEILRLPTSQMKYSYLIYHVRLNSVLKFQPQNLKNIPFFLTVYSFLLSTPSDSQCSFTKLADHSTVSLSLCDPTTAKLEVLKTENPFLVLKCKAADNSCY